MATLRLLATDLEVGLRSRCDAKIAKTRIADGLGDFCVALAAQADFEIGGGEDGEGILLGFDQDVSKYRNRVLPFDDSLK